MITPFFISHSKGALANWIAAFPDVEVLLPDHIRSTTASLAFVNVDRMEGEQKKQVVAHAVTCFNKVIVLSPTPAVDDAIAMIKMGASGYGHTHTNATMLREMALVVDHGGLWVGSALLKRVMAALAQPDSTQPAVNGGRRDFSFDADLSEREVEVARHVATGATNQEISLALGIKERTVKAHITSIFSKLDVRNRVELALLLNNIAILSPKSNANHPAGGTAL